MKRYLRAASREFTEWSDSLISSLPGRLGGIMRVRNFKRKVKKSGNNIYIEEGVRITGGENIEVGDNLRIMRHSSLCANDGGVLKMGNNISINSNTCIGAANGGEIIIGDNVLIAQNVVLRASDHASARVDIPIIQQGHTGGRIIVGKDVWISANAMITKDVNIGDHSIVAAGAVVTKDVEPFSVVGGVPAKLINKRA